MLFCMPHMRHPPNYTMLRAGEVESRRIDTVAARASSAASLKNQRGPVAQHVRLRCHACMCGGRCVVRSAPDRSFAFTMAEPEPSEACGLPDWLHDSIVDCLLGKLDTPTLCAVMSTCRRLRQHCDQAKFWTQLVFDGAAQQRSLSAAQLLHILERSQGQVQLLHLARSPEACAAEGHARFMHGYKHDQVLPHTMGQGAWDLASKCRSLRHLSIDERASCVGGMTNDLAFAMAAHCSQLHTLDVHFERYSLPSERFTDEGLIALTEGCRALRRVALRNCDGISDRSLYALAANCRRLEHLTLGGYNENVTDGGICIVAESCAQLQQLRLSSKLLKVTDVAAAALAAHCPAVTHLKLSRAMTDAALLSLARGCPRLVEVDLHRCSSISARAVHELLTSCRRLQRLVLPHSLQLEQLLKSTPRCSLQVNEERELQQLLLTH